MVVRGFTLLEMAITVLIFGVIGVIATQLLTQAVQTSDKVMNRSSTLMEWHRAMTIVEQDFLQLAQRPIRDEFGDTLPSLVSVNTGEIEFTRLGWQNPLGERRSDLQRIRYFLHGGTLIRRYWGVLDRPHDASYVDQVLLTTLESVEFQIIDAQGKRHHFWPTASDGRDQFSQSYAIAIEMQFDMRDLGEVSQVWLVPATLSLTHSVEPEAS